ncbi:MAG: monovalent cation:H+ antiporter-2 CPA2 family [Puniceicoccaceae bacterium 5H]|nr:MAG: monovalent cation:H+ antiporter-2 CPA2 family [Puniceicoccaceae bacterium 5H]
MFIGAHLFLAAAEVGAQAAEAAAHGNHLIADLGIVLIGAAVAVLVCQRFKLPVIFGYLAAGALLGPNVFQPSFVSSIETITQLSELGVIFLLFFIGLEFDLKRLKAILGPALLALIGQTIAMIYLAQLIAVPLGWNGTESLFFGSLLAISSSMVTIKVLRELGRMQAGHAQLAVGVLILEDVLAVMLLVILTGVAVSREFDWGSAGLVIFLMGIFVVLVFVIGRLIAPRLLARLGSDDRSREAVTVVSGGLVLGLSVMALKADFSSALGAFLAGAVLSQTSVAHRIEDINRSLHDLFAAIFFVTIGMQLQPDLILQDWYLILVISALVIVGKVGSVAAGLALAGQPPRSSFRGALAKAQIGEFSFIIASLGRSLEVTDERLTSLAFGVAFATIFATPLLSERSGPIYDRLQRIVPGRVREWARFYREFLDNVLTSLGRNMVLRLIQRPLLQITLYFFLQNGIVVGAYLGSNALQAHAARWTDYAMPLVWVAAAALSAPLVLAVVRNLNAIVFILTDAMFAANSPRPIFPKHLRVFFNNLLLGMVLFVTGAIYLATAAPFLPPLSVLVLFLAILFAAAVLGWRQLIRINSQMEYWFMETFSLQVQDAARARREQLMSDIRSKYPWPVQVQELVLAENAQAAGKRVRDLNLRAETGASIVALGRDSRQVLDPGADTPLFPGDRIFLLGTSEQLSAAAAQLQAPVPEGQQWGAESQEFAIDSVLVNAGSYLDDNTLAGAKVRQRFGVTVVGIQRGEERITSPRPDARMQTGDIVYVVGSPKALAAFVKRCNQAPTEENNAILGTLS